MKGLILPGKRKDPARRVISLLSVTSLLIQHAPWRPSALLLASLLAVNAPAAELRRFALRGAVADPSAVTDPGTVYVEDGRVLCAGDCPAREGFAVIETSGVILPGLVDAHNHFDWNAHSTSSWSPARARYDNRYQWQDKDPAVPEPGWTLFRKAHGDLFKGDDAFLDLMHRRGDVQALLGGVTTMQGGYRGYAPGLTRSPEWDARPSTRTACSSVFPLCDLDPSRDGKDCPPYSSNVQYLRDCFLKTPSDKPRLVVHLAEGTDALSAAEYGRLARLLGGLPQDRLTVIHGLGLSSASLADLSLHQGYLVWSPSSNMRLYGSTLKPSELPPSLRVALGADWALSGSKTLLQEIRYAAGLPAGFVRVSSGSTKERELTLMATSRAAEAVGLGSEVGRLAPGYRADVLVLRGRPGLTPYENLVASGEGDVALVLVGGRGVYGDAGLIGSLQVPDGFCEGRVVCGEVKRVCITDDDAGDLDRGTYTLSGIEGGLGRKMGGVASVEDCAP